MALASYIGSMGIFADFDTLEAMRDDDLTPIDDTICPDCGSTMIMIGVSMAPPLVAKIWKTVFGELCVHTHEWRWCCGGGVAGREGHLDIHVAPDTYGRPGRLSSSMTFGRYPHGSTPETD